MINIVLLEPEIPFNTGAIGRTCVATGGRLHLIRPLGFEIDDKTVKRAGLDYWKELDYIVYDSYNDFCQKNKNINMYYATTKALNTYADVSWKQGDWVMFGKESAGIPEEILKQHPRQCIRIPMNGETRSLNLSNSVAIIVYEAERQLGFENLKKTGSLHRLKW